MTLIAQLIRGTTFLDTRLQDYCNQWNAWIGLDWFFYRVLVLPPLYGLSNGPPFSWLCIWLSCIFYEPNSQKFSFTLSTRVWWCCRWAPACGQTHTHGLSPICPGVWNSLGISMSVGVNYNKRGSTNIVIGSVASIRQRLCISLALGNTLVDQTSTITNSLSSSGNTDNSSDKGNGN